MPRALGHHCGARRRGILSISHHRRSAQSNAASDMWIGLVRTNGSVARRPATDAQRLRSAVERFHWVGRLPCAASLRVAFCLKGLRCSDRSADLARQIAPAELYSCVEEPAGRANGTEAVCAFRFLVDNYERRDWAGVYFAHDDLAVNGAHIASFDALETFLRRSEWPQWPESPYDLSARECGCAVVRERGFGQGYYWWKPMHWWIESFRGRDGEQLVADQRLHWPLSFMFAVDALTVRRHRRSYYVALHRLARQGIQLQHDIQVGPGSLGDGFNMVYHPDTFGHAMERLPFLLFANGSTGEHDALCEPHCSSNASSMLGPRALANIRRKVQLLNQRAVFPPDVALPSPLENLVRVSKAVHTPSSASGVWNGLLTRPSG